MEGGDGASEDGSGDVPWTARDQADHDFKMARERSRQMELELELAKLRPASPSGSVSDAGRTFERCSNTEWRKYAKLLVGAFPKFPADAEVPIWFESVEHTLEAYEVPRSYWGQIVFPLVAERIEYLSTRLTPAQHRDYETVKEVVLDELKLSPLEYQKKFTGARKRKTETWKSFTTRLGSYLNFYVASRDVSTFTELLELLVVDQLKTVLSEEALKYLRLREGAAWYKSTEIARLLHTFEDANGSAEAQKGQPRNASSKGVEKTTDQQSSSPSGPSQGSNTRPKGSYNSARQPRKTGCFECGSNTHIRLNCPHYLERVAPNPSASEGNDKLTARVCLDKVTPADRLWKVTLNCKDKTLNAIVDTGAEITVVQESVVPEEFIQAHGRVSLRAAFGERVEAKLVELPLTLKQGQPVFAEVSQATPVLCAVTDKLNVSECLLSASDWTALQQSQCDYDKQDMTLSPQNFSDEREAAAKLDGRVVEQSRPTPDYPRSAEGSVLQPSEVERTREEEVVTAVAVEEGESGPEGERNAREKTPHTAENEASCVSQSGASGERGDFEALREEQQSDETLGRAWRDAAEGRGGMLVIDGLLYHREQVLGQPIKQLVLPITRRADVLSLAHESYWGGHLGFRKTKARIKLSFFLARYRKGRPRLLQLLSRVPDQG